MAGVERYVIEAILLEGASPSALARTHHISRSWIYELRERFQQGGYQALEPRSRRPLSCPRQVSQQVQDEVLKLRAELSAAGHDAGPQTIAHHLAERVSSVPSVTTVWRILKRHGLVTPQPHKRPRRSYIRFEAKLPNETWQVDATPWQLADGSPVEVLNFVDDHSRLCLSSTAFTTVKAMDVVQTFYQTTDKYGLPASLLSDNAAVFTGRTRRGKVLLELELERLGIRAKHSTPNHPQTCGKVERFHQTLKHFLAHQTKPASLSELQFQLDAFRDYYNSRRPHRSLGRMTPLTAFNARLKARPTDSTPLVDHRIRRDKIDSFGKVTIRYLGRLRHIAVGAVHRHRKVTLLVAGADVRIVTEDGELLRALSLDASRAYQPLNGRWPVHNVLQQASPSGMS
jgi:transposase InsO family protein